MDKIFQKIIDSNFSDFKGSTLHGSVPVSQSLINEITVIALQGNRTIRDCEVLIHAGSMVSVNVRTTLLPWVLKLRLKLDKSLDLGSYSSPKLRAWLENHRLLGSLGSFFNMLPEGIDVYGNQLVIDMGVLLETSEQKKLLALIRSAEIRTEEGKVIFEVSIKVDE